ncbi:DMT family transporter [Pelagibius litoralis]|uniref:DMT family transporter n=1 Tax=Pelagibius litoralis TaxID=374515 RepID=A0A967C6T0_9PROT|nr:DMT family transporter [Pelagibius litoralis]NIA68606.1 DMT family transporter [Pelagibius litoralis]
MTDLSETQPSALPSAVLYGLTAALIWGAWPVISALGIRQSLAVADIAALRFLVAGLILLPLVIRHGTGGLGWGRALFLSLGAGAPYVLVTASGLTYAPAGQGGIIGPSCMLVFATLGGWLLLGDRPPRQRLIGMVLMLTGVLLIGSQALGDYQGEQWKGHLLFATGGLLWASYTVALRAWGADPLQATALVSVLSLLIYGPIYLLIAEPQLFAAPLAEVAGQAVFQGLFAAILALICYSRAVALLGAGRGAVFVTLVPVVAVLLAYPLLGEVPSLTDLTGAAFVTAGMITALGLLPRSRV